jgi:hypothetical protein
MTILWGLTENILNTWPLGGSHEMGSDESKVTKRICEG